jgi:hypothetical protein
MESGMLGGYATNSRIGEPDSCPHLNPLPQGEERVIAQCVAAAGGPRARVAQRCGYIASSNQPSVDLAGLHLRNSFKSRKFLGTRLRWRALPGYCD